MGSMADEWLEKAPETGYIEIDITGDALTFSISAESKDLLLFLEQNGITYGEKNLILCG